MTTTTRDARRQAEGGRKADAAPIDPRIRARRVAVRRSAGRRRLRWVTAGVALIGLVLVALGLLFTPLFDVDHLTVGGQYRTAPEEVVAAGGIDRGEPLALADLGAAERRVEALPWVDEATVTRDWPGTVRYRLVERVPAAAVATADGSFVVVDGEGRVLALLGAATDDLPVVEGATAEATVGATLADDQRDAVAVAAAIPAAARPLVDAVVTGTDGSVTLRLAAGGVVTIGPLDDLAAKGVALASVLAAVDPCVATLDLSVASAPLLTRTPGCG